MGWVRERKLDVQEAWLVYSGKLVRGIRRLSLQSLREKALELNERPARRKAAQAHILKKDFQEHPERYPFFSAPTQPLDPSQYPQKEE